MVPFREPFSHARKAASSRLCVGLQLKPIRQVFFRADFFFGHIFDFLDFKSCFIWKKYTKLTFWLCFSRFSKNSPGRTPGSSLKVQVVTSHPLPPPLPGVTEVRARETRTVPFAHSAWPCLVGLVGLVSCFVWCVWLVWWVWFVFCFVF